MMSMLNKTPIDYVIWGNHEHDMAHEDVMNRAHRPSDQVQI